MDNETAKLAQSIRSHLEEMCEAYPNEFIVIGGWAAQAYGVKKYSLDGDAVLSAVSMGTIRDYEVVTPNPRMRKCQYQKDGYDVDLYVEYQNGLRVPFDEIQAGSRWVAGLCVPQPEHLLILKLDAAHARSGSEKGMKDLEDIAGLIGVIAKEPDCETLDCQYFYTAPGHRKYHRR